MQEPSTHDFRRVAASNSEFSRSGHSSFPCWEHAFHNVHAEFVACLHDDLADAVSHRTLQNLIAIFCRPHDVEPVIQSRVRGFGRSHKVKLSRRVVGWSMQSRMTTDLALQALLSPVRRHKPKHRVLIHSDQGSQFTGKEWQSFLSKHNLDASMSRRGNCHDNAVAESFFHLLKRERIRRRTYTTRDAARQDVFDYIEMFYNPTRKHTNNGMLSPVDYETEQRKMNEAGV